MSSISDLQNQLRSLYELDIKHRLSERSCVAIILKLIERGELEVIYTSDGKEYITPQQLDSEIILTIHRHGGRIDILELPPILNVDISAIEPKIAHLIHRHGNYHLTQGEIFSEQYLDTVAQEINNTLQEKGMLSLMDLITRFNLDLQFITEKIIQKYLGSVILGVLEEKILYTDAFIANYESQIRGIFTAILEPTPIATIQARYKLIPKLYLRVINQLIQNKLLPGALQGSGINALFTPAFYESSRLKYIQSFVSSNQYIDFQLLAKLKISSPLEYVATAPLPAGAALHSCYVLEHVITTTNEAIMELIHEKTWSAIHALVPFHLNEKDQIQLVEKCPVLHTKKKDPETHVFVSDHVFVCSSGFIADCLNRFETFYTTQAKQSPPQASSTLHTSQPAKNEPVKGPRATKKSKQEQQKTNKHKRQQKKGKEDDEEEDDVAPKSEIEKEIQQQLLLWFPPKADTDETFFQCLSKHVKPGTRDHLTELYMLTKVAIVQLKEKAITLAHQSTTGLSKDKLKALPKKIDVLWLTLAFFEKSLEIVLDEPARSTLLDYLLSSLGEDLVDHMLEFHALQEGIPCTVVNAETRQALIEAFPKPTATICTAAVTATKQKKFKAFADAIEAFGEHIQIQLRPLDSKSSRTLLATHRENTLRDLAGCEDPVVAFHLICTCLEIQHYKSILYINTFNAQHFQIVLKLLTPKISEDQNSELNEYLTEIQEYWTAKENDPDQVSPRLEKLKAFQKKMAAFFVN